MSFILHPQLAADSLIIGETPLCQVLLFKKTQLPWVILVPKRAGLRELYQLTDGEQRDLAYLTNCIGQRLMSFYAGDKLNTGAIGNLVSQLHIHIVVRFIDDEVWPKPVWGNAPNKFFSSNELQTRILEIRNLISDQIID